MSPERMARIDGVARQLHELRRELLRQLAVDGNLFAEAVVPFEQLNPYEQAQRKSDAIAVLAADPHSKALEFYAEPKRYEKRIERGRGHAFRISDVEEDGGKVARALLGLPEPAQNLRRSK